MYFRNRFQLFTNMINLHSRIRALDILGSHISNYCKDSEAGKSDNFPALHAAVQRSKTANSWFTTESTKTALEGICIFLRANVLQLWSESNEIPQNQKHPVTVGLVMAGNLPAVGFHDLISVIISGHRAMVKLSSDDKYLIPAMFDMLMQIEPELKDQVIFTENRLSGIDAVIATGSDNTSRYFEFYFAKYPHIIRRNRNGIGLILGDESKVELEKLADDIFLFFGLGCRSVSKIYLPMHYSPTELFRGFEGHSEIRNHSKYFNNYEYNKAIFLINGIRHFDNGFVLLREENMISSPVAVIHYAHYETQHQLREWINRDSDKIQVVVSANGSWPGSVPFGNAQKPDIEDYADGINTLEFLQKLTS